MTYSEVRGSTDRSLIRVVKDYAEFRYSTAVRAEILFDGETELGLSLSNVNGASRSIEVYGPLTRGTVLAGPIRYEAAKDGAQPILWAVDLIMTYTLYELRNVMSNSGLVQSAPLTRSQARRVVKEWSPWSEESRPRERAAAEFGNPERYGPARLASTQFGLHRRR